MTASKFRNRVPELRRTPLAALLVTKPPTHEEQEFGKAFANALNHATAVIAANPRLRPFTAGSIPERIRESFATFRPNLRPDIERRAKARLSAPVEQRRQLFGAYADLGAEAWSNAEKGLSAETKAQLKRAVSAHLDARMHEIARALSIFAATHYSGAGPTKTSVEVGYFSGDVVAGWKTLTISSPGVLHFRWTTEEPAAQKGVWALLRVGPANEEVLLQTGDAGIGPTNVFDIDLSKYLPAKPSAAPAVYHIRVTPGTRPALGPGSITGVAGPLTPGKAVGPTSDPVTITYTSIVEPAPQFKSYYYYRKAAFTVGSIRMIEDQSGPGTEEFYINGFVQEYLPKESGRSGKQVTFGDYAELDPDGPREKDLNGLSIFDLSSPEEPHEWPRAYTVVISVLEADDGGSLNEWQSVVSTLADDMLHGDIAKYVTKYLESYVREHISEDTAKFIADAVQIGGEILRFLVTLINTVASFIIGIVLAAVTMIVVDIISGMPDDYYGTDVYALALPASIAEIVEALPGETTPDGKGYKLETESIDLRGSTQWPSAASTDGEVEITFDWEFGSKELVL
jgi:hypothetical protein